jgi:hypothetical protein
MAGNRVEEIVLPWSITQTWAGVVASTGVFPLSVFYLVPVLLLAMALFPDSVPLWAKVLDGVAIAGWGAFCVWRGLRVAATPAYKEKAAVHPLLAACREYEQAYRCLQGACDEMKLFVEEKTKDEEGKPVVRRIYPTATFIVDMDDVRRVLGWSPDPRFPQLARPSLGEHVRIRFDTTEAAMDSAKLKKVVEVLVSKLGLNGYVCEVDFSRGETRHVDVVFSRTAKSGSVF